MEKTDKPVTVGDIRQAMAGLPDEALLILEWADGPPGDADPAVAVYSFAAGKDLDGTPGLVAFVGICYLDEFESDEDDDTED